MSEEPEQMIPSWKRPKNQPAFLTTSVELDAIAASWKARALDAEEKLEKIEAAICTVLGHRTYSGDYCARCGEDL